MATRVLLGEHAKHVPVITTLTCGCQEAATPPRESALSVSSTLRASAAASASQASLGMPHNKTVKVGMECGNTRCLTVAVEKIVCQDEE